MTKTHTRRYYTHDCRGFANEYRVAIATTEAAREIYEASEDWQRITRKDAIGLAHYSGDAATEAFVGIEIDGEPCTRWDFDAEIRG